MILYVVRHGQTNINLEDKINSLNDDDLNQTGVKQAIELRNYFAKIDYDLIISSPLTRTSHTSKLLNIKNRNIIYDKRLLERDAGIFTKKEIKLLDKNDWWNVYPLNNYKNAEPVKNVIKRVYLFLDEIKEKYSDKSIILVTHGGISKVISCYFYGIPSDGNLECYSLNNCEIKKIELIK